MQLFEEGGVEDEQEEDVQQKYSDAGGRSKAFLEQFDGGKSESAFVRGLSDIYERRCQDYWMIFDIDDDHLVSLDEFARAVHGLKHVYFLPHLHKIL